MKPNYMSEERTHNPAAIENRAAMVSALAARLQPAALALLTAAISSQTAASGACSLCDEARFLLADVVDHLNPEEVEFESRKLAEDLAASLEQHIAISGEDSAWIAARAQDLALDLASFWAALDDSSAAAAPDCHTLLQSPFTRRALATLGHRYYISAEQAADLVAQVQDLYDETRLAAAAAS
jgi:hypothetical protein